MTLLWRAGWCLLPLAFAYAAQDRFILSVLALAAVQALYVAGWDLVGGVSGQPTLGHALPLGVGAYVAALLGGWKLTPLPAAIAGGALAGALVGALQGGLGARLHRLSLALVTLATAECAHEMSGMLVMLWPGGAIVGGDSGIPVAVYPPDESGAARLAAAALAGGVLGLVWLERSRLGLAMRIVRADDRLAAAAGIDVVRIRVLAFVVAGATAGLAGSLAAGMIGRASPSMLSLEPSLFAFAISGVAGSGTILGPAAAAYAMTAALLATDAPGTVRLALYALLLIIAGLAPRAAAYLGGVRRGREALAPARAQ